MASKHSAGPRHQEMVHCEYCGEDYAASYKHCPFCDEMPQDDGFDGDDTRPLGGKRLMGNTRGGGYGGGPPIWKIIGTVVSLALIVAAVIIVISIIKPLVDKGKTTAPPESPPVTTSAAPSPSADPSPNAEPSPAPSPDTTDSPQLSPAPTPTAQIPASQTATGFTINRSDFTLSKAGETWDLKPTFTPAGTTGTLTWVSDKPSVATVDEKGVVKAVSRGTANITVTLAGGFTQSCIVRCNFPAGETASSGGSSSGSVTANTGTLSLNHTDFTFSSLSDPSVSMKVSGTSSTPSWSISDTSVATITAGGVVSPAGKGMATITCTVDGQTLKCIVRCTF